MNKQADKKRGYYLPPNGPKPPLFQPGDNCTMLMVEAVLKHEDRGRCKREWWLLRDGGDASVFGRSST